MQHQRNNGKDRFSWASEIVNPKPTDVILEIGCGVGLLAQPVALKLMEGRMVAVDRSESMINSAKKRTVDLVERGRLEFYSQDYAMASLDHQSFDKVIAFNVSDFWKKPTHYLPLVQQHLKTAGKFYLFHQPPVNNTYDLAQEAKQALVECRFDIEKIIFENFKPAPAFCIIAVPESTKTT